MWCSDKAFWAFCLGELRWCRSRACQTFAQTPAGCVAHCVLIVQVLAYLSVLVVFGISSEALELSVHGDPESKRAVDLLAREYVRVLHNSIYDDHGPSFFPPVNRENPISFGHVPALEIVRYHVLNFYF